MVNLACMARVAFHASILVGVAQGAALGPIFYIRGIRIVLASPKRCCALLVYYL